MAESSLFCMLRQRWVLASPEEQVRQALIHQMTQALSYPLTSLALEKSLHQLPHLALIPTATLPKRRADLIVFAKDIHPDYALYPLLLIECKAIALNSKVIRQVVGYNQFVGAYFIGLANQTDFKLGWHNRTQNALCFTNHLPPYAELLQQTRLLSK